jgi:phenylalanyl-tRNA synthetase beta chain
MTLSYNWLKNYIDLDIDPNELSVLLTDCGLEVEGMEFHESIKGGLKGIKVGKVLSCEKHSNADKLSVTTVDVGGDSPLPIVCGAPNVAAGQTVLVATVGTELYSGDESFKINKSKIRGEVSEGMICAEDELQLGESHDGIMVLSDDFEIGSDASKYFPVTTDYIYEIGLTPNRADATSHIGSARDLVSVINRFYPEKKLKLKKPDVSAFKVDNHNLPIEINIRNQEACSRYSGVCIDNIEVKESPQWLKDRLNAVGLRPINNIVDVTNFVLMETGHPLHAFDYDKIDGNIVNIQTVSKGTKFTTLDEVERELNEQDLMICNAKEPMCIAGVFGGNDSGVKNETKNIFIESAYFDSVFVRKTSKRHGLKTDASFRFERGADPNITVYALKRAALLIKEIAGGNIASEIHDVYPKPIHNWIIELRYNRLNKLIGQVIEPEMVKSILSDMDIIVLSETDDVLKLEIPTYKVDVTREVDVIEEVLRVYGYNNIKFDDQIRSSINNSIKPDRDQVQNLISEFMVANGFNEIMNNSLTKAAYYEDKKDFSASDSVKILNPLSSELNVLRQSLVFGGLESIKRNINHKSPDIKFFEFGKHYRIQNPDEVTVEKKYHESMHLGIFISGSSNNENWKNPSQDVDFFELKSMLVKILNRFAIDLKAFKVSEIEEEGFAYGLTYIYKNKQIAKLGKVSANFASELEIEQDVFYLDVHFDNLLSILNDFKTAYKELAKFPAVRRDLALLVDKGVTYSDIEKAVKKADKKLLKSVNLFDVYEGKGIPSDKKSYAISMSFQDENRTLTDKIIDKSVKKAIWILENELGAKLR